MRILVLANEDEGLFQFRGELLIELIKDHEVYTSVPEGKYLRELNDIGCKVLKTKLERHGVNPFSDLSLIFQYKKFIRNIKPDLVLTYTIKPNVYGGFICRIMRIPYFVNITGLGTAVENPGLLQLLTVRLYKIGLKRAAIVFFQNIENKDFMITHKIVKNKYVVIPGSGVNLNRFALLPFPQGKHVEFAFISRIMKQKGIEQYLEAAKQIKEKYPNTIFHICGYFDDNDYKEKINEYQRNGIVVYHGNLRDVREIHKIVQCVIHPSYYPEGLSNVLLESSASGRAIITTNRSGCKEVVDDGVNGYLIREKDTKDLVEKIEKFLMLSWETRRDMGLAGRDKVEREFDRKIVIDSYLSAIEDINGLSRGE